MLQLCNEFDQSTHSSVFSKSAMAEYKGGDVRRAHGVLVIL